MPATEPSRPALDPFERRLLDGNPIAAYARLHVVAPVALVAIALLLLLGSTSTVHRYQEQAGDLMTAPAARHEYIALGKEAVAWRSGVLGERYRAWVRRGQGRLLVSRQPRVGVRTIRRSQAPVNVRMIRRREALIERRHLAAVEGRMRRLAAATGLRDCHVESFVPAGLTCEGRHLEDGTVVAVFWSVLFAGALALLFWLYIQLRDSWMLPHWNPRLWYTPVYAATIGLATCGPFLMMGVYYRRAEADYVIPPERLLLAEPSLLLYFVVLLQFSAIVIGAVKSHSSARSFAIGTALLALGALVGVALLYVRLGLSSILVGILCGGGVAVLLRSWSNANTIGRSRASAQHVLHTGELSRGLVPAWIALILGAGLQGAGGHVGWISSVSTVAGYLACLVYVVRSGASELGLGRHQPVPKRA